MSSNLPVPQGSFWDLVKNFDFLKVPGAVRAIARLVTSVGDAGAAAIDIGTAKAEQVATGIRIETDARKKLSAALADAAVRQALSDPNLAGRALEQWSGAVIRKQVNREEIAKIAIEHLSETPPPPNTEGPSDDWMNVFEQHAENATSDRLRQTWGRILAGEIRKPGTFSLTTLSFISVLDVKLANTVQNVVTCLIAEFIPIHAPFSQGPHYTQLMDLAEVGFFSMGSSKIFQGANNLAFPLGKTHLLVWTPQKPENKFHVGAAILTRAGKEIVSIIDYQPNLAMIQTICEGLGKQHNFSFKILPIEKAG